MQFKSCHTLLDIKNTPPPFRGVTRGVVRVATVRPVLHFCPPKKMGGQNGGMGGHLSRGVELAKW